MTKKLFGNAPDQIPTNADLGSMAYQNSDSVSVKQVRAKGLHEGDTLAPRHSRRPGMMMDFANGKAIHKDFRFIRTTTGSYVDQDGIIKYAGVGEPRFEYCPTTGEALGLLMEPSATNYLAARNDRFEANSYLKQPRTDNYGVAPDGTQTSSRFAEASGTSAGGYCYYSGSSTMNTTWSNAGNGYHVQTWFIKINSFPDATGRIQFSRANKEGLNIDGVAGENGYDDIRIQAFDGTGNPVIGAIKQKFQNGWWRVGMIIDNRTGADTPTYEWQFLSGAQYGGVDIELWGHQIEKTNSTTNNREKFQPSSVIIKDGNATVTRNPDYLKADATNATAYPIERSWMRWPCTVYIEMLPMSNTSNYGMRMMGLRGPGNIWEARPFFSGGGNTNWYTSLGTVNTNLWNSSAKTDVFNRWFTRAAFKIEKGKFTVVESNHKEEHLNWTTNTLGFGYTNKFDLISIGYSANGDGPREFFGHIRKFAIYNYAMPDEEMLNLAGRHKGQEITSRVIAGQLDTNLDVYNDR